MLTVPRVIRASSKCCVSSDLLWDWTQVLWQIRWDSSMSLLQRASGMHMLGASIAEEPRGRLCPSSGTTACTYQRWFRHDSTQEHVLCMLVLSSTPVAAFSFGVATACPVLSAGVLEFSCSLCREGLADEKHLVFECIALSPIRSRFQHPFQCTMSSFMNQDAQRDVMYFVTDCLQFYLENFVLVCLQPICHLWVGLD
jgi:hypothetical protein